MTDISLAAARDRYYSARAAYQAIAHRLSVPQRQDFRMRLAKARAAFIQSERAHWQHLFTADEEVVIGLASHYYRSPAHREAAAQLAIIRAQHHASQIADAVVRAVYSYYD